MRSMKKIKILTREPAEQADRVPYTVPVEGIHQLLPLSRTFPPVGRTNCFLLGDREAGTFIIDPSPGEENEYGRLVERLKEFGDMYRYTGIFITHHHIDHHERAPALARDFSIPVTMSKNTLERIIKKRGVRYFESIGVNTVKEGDVLTRWRGRDVRVYEVPGHDEGQLALAPDGMEWFLVGDLVQGNWAGKGGGTVVIGNEEGNMRDYFQTLERIIALDPKILLPSHGMAMKSTAAMEKTLNHRRYRERQVLRLYEKGHTPEEMVAKIYKNIDPGLWPWGLENINAHMKKLKEDGVIED